MEQAHESILKAKRQSNIQQNPKFCGEQYALILNFLEDPQNKAKIFGVSGKTEVGVAPPRKIEAWKELTTLINSKFKGKYKLDHKSVADRWRTYFNKYKAARDKSSATGFGVTDEDKKKNIHTVHAKLDMMCPHYERMHAPVGERPNVNPAATFDSGSISLGTDLNELLKFNAQEGPCFLDDDPAIENHDTPGSYDFIPTANEDGISPHTIVVSNEEVLPSPQSQPKDDVVFLTELDASPMVAVGTKRHAKFDSSDGNKSKKDRRKELPSLSVTRNPTLARNHLAQTIQDCASAKAAAVVAIEEKRLTFEQLKWETEREEREVRRIEQKEDERVRRAEEKAEKCKDRRFALLQTMIADGKSAAEIKEILDMLL